MTTRSSSTSARSSTWPGSRPFNALHAIPLPAAAGVDGVGGFNTNTIALDIPLNRLTKDHAQPTGPNDPDAVLGVWATASRKKIRVLDAQRHDPAVAVRGSRSLASATR